MFVSFTRGQMLRSYTIHKMHLTIALPISVSGRTTVWTGMVRDS